jgi:hypothetical protein
MLIITTPENFDSNERLGEIVYSNLGKLPDESRGILRLVQFRRQIVGCSGPSFGRKHEDQQREQKEQ